MLSGSPLTADFEAAVLEAPLARRAGGDFSRYGRAALLAVGGQAELYRAVDLPLGRDVALKVLRRELADEPGADQRLVREARLTAALDHPAIAPVYDMGRDPAGRPYFAMALRPGPTLHAVLGGLRRGSAAVERRWQLVDLVGALARLAEALDYAHRRQVVHGDLKPENVLLGADGAVTLLDWGLAVVAEPRARRRVEAAVFPRERVVLGSPQYMAPEAVQGGPLGPAADVYGLGVLLYECLTLQTPHRGATAAATLRQIVAESPMPPGGPAPQRGVPPRVDAVCLAALAKSPGDRWSSVAALRDALQECALELWGGDESGEPKSSPTRVSSDLRNLVPLNFDAGHCQADPFHALNG